MAAQSAVYRHHPIPEKIAGLPDVGSNGITPNSFRQGHRTQGELDPPFYLLTTRLDLVGDADTLIGAIAAQLGSKTSCAVIVIDTLNRSLHGSENSDEDMAAYIRAADRMRKAFDRACREERAQP